MNRDQYLGSSDAKDIVSLPPYGCRRALVYRKAGVPVDNIERQRVRFSPDEGPVARGIILEPLIRERVRSHMAPCYEWLSLEAAQQIEPRHDLPAWLRATPDGLIPPLDDDAAGRLAYRCRVTLADALRKLLTTTPGLLEGKTVQQADLWRIRKQGPREDHVLQCQHQMAATGAKWLVLAYLNADGWAWCFFLLLRDEAWEKEIYIPACITAWTEITRAKTGIDLGASPDLWESFLPARLAEGSKQCRTCDHRQTCWGSAYARIMEIPTDGDAANMDGVPEWEAAVADLLAANEILEDAEQIKEQATEKLKAMMGDQPVAEGGGARIYYKPQITNRLDTKAIQRDHPEIAKQYTKPSTSRPFRAYPV